METEKLVTKIGKLLSGTRKPEEGFATIFAYEPRDFLEKQHGSLYFVIEVASGSSRATDVGETIINSIKEEFYEDLNRSVILSFESALRKANEELSDLTSAGETDWIGKLNVAVAVISEEKLHLSKVGTTEAYIIRGSKITHISEGLNLEEEKDKNLHPLKTFSTITSGALQKNDKIILSSQELFYHISLAGLKKIVSENNPSKAILKLKELLEYEEGIGSLGLLIIEITTEEELAKEPVKGKVDEVWIKEPKTGESLVSFISSTFDNFKKFLKNNFGIKKEEIPPPKKPEKPEKKEEIISKNQDLSKTAKNKEGFLEFVINYFKNFSFKKFKNDSKDALLALKNNLKEKIHSTYFKLFIIVALFFVITLGIVIRNYYVEKYKKEVKAKLDYAVSLEEKAEGALIYEAKTQAKEYLSEAKALTEEVLKTKYYKKEALELLAKIAEQTKKAQGIFEINPNLVLETDKEIDVPIFTFLNKKLYLVNNKNGELIIYDIEKKEKNVEKINAGSGNFIQIAVIPTTKIIVIYKDNPEIFEFNPKNKKIEKITIKELKKGEFLATYSSNLYILSKEENQIYRYSKFITGYSSPSKYITDKSIDIKNSSSLTIPGFVYILQDNGEVIKLLKGKKQEFNLKEMPFNFKNPIKIQSNEGSGEIYILDKELGILVFSVNGKYIKNITSSEFKDLKDFYVDEKSGIIYVLSGNKILSFGK